MSSKLISHPSLYHFVRGQYPDDMQGQVESLHLKLRALYSMLKRLTPEQKREAGDTAQMF
jgi:hypothetical protein